MTYLFQIRRFTISDALDTTGSVSKGLSAKHQHSGNDRAHYTGPYLPNSITPALSPSIQNLLGWSQSPRLIIGQWSLPYNRQSG